MMSAYFDDIFVFRDTYQELYVALKVLLMAATEAKIKFSSEKSKFAIQMRRKPETKEQTALAKDKHREKQRLSKVKNGKQ